MPKRIYNVGRLLKASDLLTDPLTAFTAAMNPALCEVKASIFARALQLLCMYDPTGPLDLSGDPLQALPFFLQTIQQLVHEWAECEETPILDAPEEHSRLEPWLDRYESTYLRIRLAQVQRPFTVRLKVVNHRLFSGDGYLPTFVGVASYQETAEVAALALFGDFLAKERDTIGFCEKCHSPFQSRSNKQYCSPTCGRLISSAVAHRSRVRRQNKERLIAASKALKVWIAHPTRNGWRPAVEAAAQVTSRDGRRSRWLTTFALAAQEPISSKRLETLVDQCFDRNLYRHSPDRLQDARKRTELLIKTFLEQIRTAEKLAQGKSQ